MASNHLYKPPTIHEFEEWQEKKELEMQLAAFAKTKKFPMTHAEANEAVVEFVSWQNEVGSNKFLGDMQRTMYPGGMERSSSEDKIDYLLIRDGPMFERWAAQLNEGAKRHEPRNWMLAAGEEEHERFYQSAARHFEAWLRGDTDEDHAAALFFNVNGAEYTKNKVNVAVSPRDVDVDGWHYYTYAGGPYDTIRTRRFIPNSEFIEDTCLVNGEIRRIRYQVAGKYLLYRGFADEADSSG